MPVHRVLCSSLVLISACGGSGFNGSGDNPGVVPSDDSLSVAADADGLLTDDALDGLESLPGENPVAVDNLGPEQDSRLAMDDQQYPLKSALADIWGSNGEHYQVDFTLSNGKFVVRSETIDGTAYDMLIPMETSALFHVKMFSPGEEFSFVSYGYSPFDSQGGVLSGTPYFADAYVGVDADLNGDVDEDEIRQVIGGTIRFSGSVPDLELSFSVQLDSGQSAEGFYTGLFDFTDRR